MVKDLGTGSPNLHSYLQGGPVSAEGPRPGFVQANQKPGLPDREATIGVLIDALKASQAAWDQAYIEALANSSSTVRQTEEVLKIRVRNELRAQGIDYPEIVRWRLRGAIQYRSEEE